MKAMITAMVLGAMTLGGVANAIDLRNEDESSHTVTVTSSSMSRDVEMRGLTMSFVVCVGVCEFEVAGVVVKASKDDVVTIKDGKVSMTTRR